MNVIHVAVNLRSRVMEPFHRLYLETVTDWEQNQNINNVLGEHIRWCRDDHNNKILYEFIDV